MKTYLVSFNFGTYNRNVQFAEISVDTGFSLEQVASIFAARMDCHALQILSVVPKN